MFQKSLRKEVQVTLLGSFLASQFDSLGFKIYQTSVVVTRWLFAATRLHYLYRERKKKSCEDLAEVSALVKYPFLFRGLSHVTSTDKPHGLRWLPV